ncbi:4Fe-4S cluster-binding domain-containing protein [Cohnella sp. 56]|uniref:4Fe-4S cluster-binding domain-containing protein n=1 Tax=Cohnella sp. 56 TaxID=3113722 RepID=UPI0030E84010
MRVADYKRFDMLNGPGIRHSLFVSGCRHRCDGCFNAAAWNFDYGELWTAAYADRVVADLRPERADGGAAWDGPPGRAKGGAACDMPPGAEDSGLGIGRQGNRDGDGAAGARRGLRIDGLSLLGGEPFDNTDGLAALARTIRAECPGKTIWVWSGYTYEQLMAEPRQRELLVLCDVLVDGKYEASRRNLKLRWRGSDNQRIVDVPASLACGAPMTLPY